MESTSNNKKGLSTIAKVGLIGGAGVIGWLLFSSFKSARQLPPGDLPIVPGDTPDPLGQGEMTEAEYGVALQKYRILKAGNWGHIIREDAKKKGISFEQELNDVAVKKYFEQGTPTGEIAEFFERAINVKTYKIEHNVSLKNSIIQKAQDKGYSYENMLMRDAIWLILKSLSDYYINYSGGGGGGSVPDDPQDNYINNNGTYNGVGRVVSV